MTEPKKDLEIVILPEVQAQLDADPDMAEAIRDFMAACRQAKHAVDTGQHESFNDAMEAITGNRPEPVDISGDEE